MLCFNKIKVFHLRLSSQWSRWSTSILTTKFSVVVEFICQLKKSVINSCLLCCQERMVTSKIVNQQINICAIKRHTSILKTTREIRQWLAAFLILDQYYWKIPFLHQLRNLLSTFELSLLVKNISVKHSHKHNSFISSVFSSRLLLCICLFNCIDYTTPWFSIAFNSALGLITVEYVVFSFWCWTAKAIHVFVIRWPIFFQHTLL